jgi:glucose-6-phosphate-specific signal transduction histidine kinase
MKFNAITMLVFQAVNSMPIVFYLILLWKRPYRYEKTWSILVLVVIAIFAAVCLSTLFLFEKRTKVGTALVWGINVVALIVVMSVAYGVFRFIENAT